MALFNFLKRKTSTPNTTNLARGTAYTLTPEMELVTFLFTSFVQEQFYRSTNASIEQLRQLLGKVEPEFAAKAAVYVRTTLGMRSISHVLASELAPYISGVTWGRAFFNQIVFRPDDMTEILGYAMQNNPKFKLPNAMRKGFSSAFDRFDTYQLAKYRSDGKQVKLVDVVNMVRPTPTDRNAVALSDLVKGRLRNTNTWEARLTQAGQIAETAEQKSELKAEVWKDLLQKRQIGYFALLRNLRNIVVQAPELTYLASELLTNPMAIKKSLVLPFRFDTAYREIKQLSDSMARTIVLAAIEIALSISVDNVPIFKGKTLVVLDTSGSMQGKPAQIGGLLAVVVAQSNNADFMTFSDAARYEQYNWKNSTLSLVNELKFVWGGTNFDSIFETAKRAYDRIIILSDMQAWVGGGAPVESFANYCKRTGANPFIYSFDLQGYGSIQFPLDKVFCLAGFSDKIFDIMSLLETDRNAMVNEIKKISWNKI